jgi:hypothetical protein
MTAVYTVKITEAKHRSLGKRGCGRAFGKLINSQDYVSFGN